MRRLLTQYGVTYARPNLFDMVLPPSIPTLRDLGRRRFQRAWMGLMLVAARDPETGSAFSAEQLRDQVATMILAGHETTAVTLFWSLVLLSGVPSEQARVAAEVRDLAITPDTAMEVLPRLVQTRAVISEALRLYPPAFTLVREAISHDRVGELDIPRGSILMIAPWVLGRHRKLWHEPDVFDPSRFLPDAPAIPRFAYLPFGAGPRICVGAQFALTEATLALAAMIQAFEVSMDAADTPMPVAVVTTQPDHPPNFTLRRRTSVSPPLPDPSAIRAPTDHAPA
jgi:cytochrome P450